MLPKRFFWRLFLSLVLLTAIASSLFGILLYRHIYDSTLESLKANLKKETVMLEELMTVSPALLEKPHELIRIVSTEDRVTIMSVNGTVIADNWAEKLGKVEIENHSNRPEFKAALAGHPIYVQRLSGTLKREMLYYAIALRDQGRVRYVVRLSFALTTFHNLMNEVRNFLFIGAILSLLLSLPVVFFISRDNTKQIETLRSGARRLSDGDLNFRIPRLPTAELSELAEDLNEMSVQLKEKIQNLQMEHQRVETLLSRMVEGVLALDGNGKAVFSNNAFSEIVGLNPARIEGKSFLEITRNNDLSEFITGLLRNRNETSSKTTEITMMTPSGEKIFSVQSSPISDVQNVGNVVLLVFHDITRIKRVEQIRKDFVANVSHELRTPLTALKGSTELLLDGAYADRVKCRKFLEIMDKQLQNLQNLVNDMLSLASAEDTRMPLRREFVNLSDLIGDVVSIIQRLMEKKNQTLEIHLLEPVVVYVDPGKISDVLINLLENASKYSDQGGRIDLIVRKDKQQLLIEVKDNGQGIPSDQLSRIFERFYRIDKSRSREMGGTGLGLAIVKHAVENHGGSVTVQSEIGKGTVFTVHLPEAVLQPVS